jgi:carboxypeptidase PM20D1
MTPKKKTVGGLIAGAGVGAAAAAALRRRWGGAGEDVVGGGAMPEPGSPAASFLEHLAEAVRFETVSYEDRSRIDLTQFDAFHEFLAATYPLAHEHLRREVIAGHSLLFTWEGLDSDAAPILLMAHQDVVPIEPGTEDSWEQAPFAGNLEGSHLWGRGTLDDKGSLIGIFEAVESLLAEGHRPGSTVYLVFGHDEEIGGTVGAAAVAAALEERGVRLSFVLDEGGAVARDFFDGLDGPIALLGVAEKGYLNVELRATGVGGHSSTPPPHTAVGLIALAIAAIEESPMPAHLDVQAPLLDAIGRKTRGIRGLALRNREMFSGMIEKALSAKATTNALIRTTGAPTLVAGGVKPNILPQEATAVVNFRILPGDTTTDVLEHVQALVPEGVEVRVLEGGFSAEPSPRARDDGGAFGLIADTITAVHPDAIVAPWILMGATDSRYFAGIADDVYRFAPFSATPDDMSRVHGTGERIAVADAAPAVEFYRLLIQSAAG